MKFVKKLSVGFLALIICFCSCFKFIYAFTVDNFYASSTDRGNTLFTPYYDITLFGVGEFSTNESSYSSYPLTFSSYYQIPYVQTNSRHNIIYDSELNAKFYGGFMSAQEFSINLYRSTYDNLYNETINYYQAYSHYIDIQQASTNRYTLSVNFKGLTFADVPYSSVDFISNSSYLSSSNVVYSYSYYDFVGNLQTETIDTSIQYSNDSISVPIIPTEYNSTNTEVYNVIKDRKIVDYNIYIDFGVSTNYDENVSIYCDYPIIDSINNRKLINILNIYDFIYDEHIDNPTINVSFTTWLVNAIDSFMSAEIFPNFSIGTMLAVIVSIPLLIYILRLFMGG